MHRQEIKEVDGIDVPEMPPHKKYGKNPWKSQPKEIKEKKKLRYTQAGVVDDNSQDCVKMMSLQLLLLS